VLQAKNGMEGLRLLQSNPIDIILCDIKMDGMEVCSRIKKYDKLKNIPFIFITGMSNDQDEEKGLEMGAIDFITKPFNSAVVIARIRAHLELHKYQIHLKNLVQPRTKELEKAQSVILEFISSLMEFRDFETGQHIERTKEYVKLLADYLKYNPKFNILLKNGVIYNI